MKNIKNLTILKTTNTSDSLMFHHGKKIIAKIGLEPPTTPIFQITFPQQKLNFFPKSRKNMQLRCKYLKKVYNIIPSGTIKENWT